MLQKRQLIKGSGPWARYRSRASREENLDLSVWSAAVRVSCSLRWERRTKRTSLGICRRDSVRRNMFSGRKGGRVERREMTAEMKRIFRARLIRGGVARIGALCAALEDRMEL